MAGLTMQQIISDINETWHSANHIAVHGQNKSNIAVIPKGSAIRIALIRGWDARKKNAFLMFCFGGRSMIANSGNA